MRRRSQRTPKPSIERERERKRENKQQQVKLCIRAELFGMFETRRISNAFRPNDFCRNEGKKIARKKIIAFFWCIFFSSLVLFYRMRLAPIPISSCRHFFGANKKLVFTRLLDCGRVNIAVADVVDVSYVLVCDDCWIIILLFSL